MPVKFFNFLTVPRKVMKFLLDILFPIECLACGKEDEVLCDECLRRIKLREFDECAVCRRPAKWGQTHTDCQGASALDGCLIPAVFEDKLLAETIHKFKYNFVTELKEPLGRILINKLNNLIDEKSQPNPLGFLLSMGIIIAPVPLSSRRLRYRDFNQAELLGYEVAQKFKIAMWPDLLRRRKNTKPQIELKREKRLVNMTGAFQLNKQYGDKIKNANILLVDDVITTGATMNECAKILKNSGAGAVWGLALARG